MTRPAYLLALDQGTSSSRALVFREDGTVHSLAQQEFPQLYPQPGWVEHDPQALWQSQLDTARQALARGGLQPSDIRAVGITNQRETTLLWHRRTGAPLHAAIVWQDRRTEPLCRQLREQGHEALIRQRTGLKADPYFSGTKLRWLLDHVPGARELARAGELAFGTVDSWLIWQLTGGQQHATDISNASRTLLLNIHTGQWDDELLALLDIPRSVLPEVRPSAADFGRVQAGLLGPGEGPPIAGVAGDQQAALLGQACEQAGQVKNTYGTGRFMLMHTGRQAIESHSGLVTTCAAQATAGDAGRRYALEGSVFMGGAVVQWLRDGLGLIQRSADVEALAARVPDSGGVVLVPAFAGLGAPYWAADARASIQGMTRGTTAAHIARAALESIALQSTVLLQAMMKDASGLLASPLQGLRVDGGACANDLLMQMQADFLSLPVLRPACLESTALGAASLAAVQAGLAQDPAELARRVAIERVFEPQGSRDAAQAQLAAWDEAVKRTTMAV